MIKLVNIKTQLFFLLVSASSLCTENKTLQPKSFFNRWFYSSSEQKERAYNTLQDLLVQKNTLEARLLENNNLLKKQKQAIIEKIDTIQQHIDEQKVILGQKWSRTKKLAVAATTTLGLGVFDYYGAPYIKNIIQNFQSSNNQTQPFTISKTSIDPNIHIDQNNSNHLTFTFPINKNFKYQWYEQNNKIGPALIPLKGQTDPSQLIVQISPMYKTQPVDKNYWLEIKNTHSPNKQYPYVVEIHNTTNQKNTLSNYKMVYYVNKMDNDVDEDYYYLPDFKLLSAPDGILTDIIFSKMKYEKDHPGFKFDIHDIDRQFYFNKYLELR